ncbi:hypothetical protein C0993_007292 [Termitomyces sp. T159_Od127]|nr:hypothetical protein C0993_007292 [Termitomyces sp. T159_Od127]
MSEAMACPTLVGPKNFQIWKIRIAGRLRQEKVWDTITSSPESPDTSTPTSAGQTDSWSTQDSNAIGIIIAHVSNRLLLEIGDLTHAKDMFDQLVKIHEETNVGVSAFYTYIHMQKLKLDRSLSSLQNHIATLSAANAKLTTMKKTIDREFLAFTLLNSLPEESP